MSLLAYPFSLIAPRRAASPAHCALAPREALSLQPTADVRVQVTQGQLWLTLDGPGHGGLPGLGDWFLGAGQDFVIPAGRLAVIEPWASGVEAEAHFTLACAERTAPRAWDGWHRLTAPLRQRQGASTAAWSGRLCPECVDGR